MIIFIHGFPFSKEMWRPQVARFGGLAYDVRGHGDADPGDGLYTIDLFAEDLLAKITEPAVLVGLSMGGYIALRAAELAPSKVKALVLADTRAEADPNQGKALRHGAMKFVAEKGVSAFADEFVKNLFSPAALATNAPCVGELLAVMKRNKPLGVRGTLLALAARMDATPWLPNIKVPTLVLVGEDDKVTPPANSETLAKSIPGAKLVVIPRAGHVSNLENPEAFNKALAEFLAAVM